MTPSPANGSNVTITPHTGPVFTFDRAAIIAVHDATGQEATDDAYDEYCNRAAVLMQDMITDWKHAHETTVVPGEVRMHYWSQSHATALEEVLEEYIHAPLRHAREDADDTDDLTVDGPRIIRTED